MLHPEQRERQRLRHAGVVSDAKLDVLDAIRAHRDELRPTNTQSLNLILRLVTPNRKTFVKTWLVRPDARIAEFAAGANPDNTSKVGGITVRVSSS